MYENPVTRRSPLKINNIKNIVQYFAIFWKPIKLAFLEFFFSTGLTSLACWRQKPIVLLNTLKVFYTMEFILCRFLFKRNFLSEQPSYFKILFLCLYFFSFIYIYFFYFHFFFRRKMSSKFYTSWKSNAGSDRLLWYF